MVDILTHSIHGTGIFTYMITIKINRMQVMITKTNTDGSNESAIENSPGLNDHQKRSFLLGWSIFIYFQGRAVSFREGICIYSSYPLRQSFFLVVAENPQVLKVEIPMKWVFVGW